MLTPAVADRVVAKRRMSTAGTPRIRRTVLMSPSSCPPRALVLAAGCLPRVRGDPNSARPKAHREAEVPRRQLPASEVT